MDQRCEDPIASDNRGLREYVSNALGSVVDGLQFESCIQCGNLWGKKDGEKLGTVL